MNTYIKHDSLFWENFFYLVIVYLLNLNGLDENSKVEQQFYCSFQEIILLCTLSSGKSVGIYVTASQNTKELNAVWNTKEYTSIKL